MTFSANANVCERHLLRHDALRWWDLEERGTISILQSKKVQPMAEADLLTFQGTLTPLLGIGVCVSIQFGVLEWSKRFFAGQNMLRGTGGDGGRLLGGDQLFVAGVLAGLGNGGVSGPVEHIRIRQSSPPLKFIAPNFVVR